MKKIMTFSSSLFFAAFITISFGGNPARAQEPFSEVINNMVKEIGISGDCLKHCVTYVIPDNGKRADLCRVIKITAMGRRDGVMHTADNCQSAYKSDADIDYNFNDKSGTNYVLDNSKASDILKRNHLQTRNCGCEFVFKKGFSVDFASCN